MRGLRILVCLLWTLGALVPSSAWAQGLVSGGIAGVVRDTSGAVLPGVTVEAASPALIEKTRSVVTDDQGQYKILELRPGTYTVTFTLSGFTSLRREAVELSAGFTAVVNAELAVGSIEETLTVSGASPLVDTQNVRTQNVLVRETLDTLPTGKTLQAFAALTVGMASGSQDVGGNRGEQSTTLSVHGGRGADQHLHYDGMRYNNALGTGAGGSRVQFVNQASVQEVVLETSGMSAEAETAGVQINIIPKDGGNTFTAIGNASYSDRALQRENVNDELRTRGVLSGPQVKRIYDYSGGLGGPIKRDRLWFYTGHRWWGGSETVPGNYFNKTPHTLFYTPDLDRPAFQEFPNEDHNIRLTWQASQKQKFTFATSLQDSCWCYFGVLLNNSPEASNHQKYWPGALPQVTWNYPVTNRLLLQGGATYAFNAWKSVRTEGVTRTDIPVRELSTGYNYGAANFPLTSALAYDYNPGIDQYNGRFSASYITGSHAFKSGIIFLKGTSVRNTEAQDPPIAYQFRKPSPSAMPVPVAVTFIAAPSYAESRALDFAAFIQDQWTLKRLTFNMGLRFDSLHGWNPEQVRPASAFIPEFRISRRENVPSWKDLSPRLGGAYDIFGNGKTAIKGFVGRYVNSELTSIAIATNPSNAIATSANRAWNDANGDYIPQPSELGALSDRNFGTDVVTTHYAADVLTGWGVRPYTWQASAVLEHELRSGIGLTAGYYRTWYGNFQKTDNLSVAPADYDPYCVTAPTDTRLAGGGGYQLCGLYDVTRQKFGLVDNRVTHASNFGEQTEVYNGFEGTVRVRFGKGALLTAGLGTGHTAIDNCVVVDSPQIDFCRITLPWAGQTQFKASGVYPLFWGLQTSAVYQNLSGAPILATRAFTNAEIAASLGRNLASCPSATGPCTATASIQLFEPNKRFENRLTQFDLRISKIVTVASGRIEGMFDIYNLFNANTIITRNNTFGAAWGLPTQILSGRTIKFGAQFNF